MKYKIGDKVRIINYPGNYPIDWGRYIGQIGTIRRIIGDHCLLDINPVSFCPEDILEPVVGARASTEKGEEGGNLNRFTPSWETPILRSLDPRETMNKIAINSFWDNIHSILNRHLSGFSDKENTDNINLIKSNVVTIKKLDV